MSKTNYKREALAARKLLSSGGCGIYESGPIYLNPACDKAIQWYTLRAKYGGARAKNEIAEHKRKHPPPENVEYTEFSYKPIDGSTFAASCKVKPTK